MKRVIRLPELSVAHEPAATDPSADSVAKQGKTLPDRIVGRIRRDVPLVLLDLFGALGSYIVGLVIRFEGVVPPDYWSNFWVFVPAAVACHLVVNAGFGLYGHMWRYASVQEARRVVFAGATGGVLVISSQVIVGGRALPLSVVIMGATFSLIGFGALRFQTRLFALRRRSAIVDRRRVLVVGAGDTGAQAIRDLLRDPSNILHPVCIVDDDRRKHGRAMQGVSVLGPISSIPELVARHDIDHVLLAIPSATSKQVRGIAYLCERANVTLRVLPSVEETMSGKITARDVRDLKIEDLLGRQQVTIDLDAVSAILRGRTVLVTGAGGSIGSEISRQVLAFAPSKLILLDHDETHLHDVATDLDDGDGVIQTVLADVRDRDRVLTVFLDLRPEVTFHAAAHKHVPILENHPAEALNTNVIGTFNVADAASISGVERFVMISTDKAIKPRSVMGASKWFAEQIVRSQQRKGCVFSSVRFGNVLGSRGSVVPTFLRQIARGGPVTVTDPDMTRYFMSTEEAVQLVLQAGALSEGGEVFTLDMGEPVKILDLACEIIRLAGRVPYKDIPIDIVGVRPGEKLTEDIADPDEESLPSAHPSMVVCRPPIPERAALAGALRSLEALASEDRYGELADAIRALAGAPLVSTAQEIVL